MNVLIYLMNKEHYWLPEGGDNRYFVVTKGKMGRPETICMLSTEMLQISLLAVQNSVAIILLMLLISTIK